MTSCSKKLTTAIKLSLNKELLQMEESDQIAASNWEEKWIPYKDSTYTSNKTRVEKMFNQYGFLGYEEIGKDGSNIFWLIVQHSDKYPDFQKKILVAMDKQVNKKNTNATNYAFLYDRVQVNAGLKQKFGTQVTYDVNRTGRAIPKIGIMDSINVDLNRKKYLLEPLKEYLNQMTIMHFEMNEANYKKMGITKPQLYL
ncbi:MAG: hypothetical protein KKD36_12695 [Bacteroidetes bacterium]|nr:hypothetical protein [Bacteroidota bacterium]